MCRLLSTELVLSPSWWKKLDLRLRNFHQVSFELRKYHLLFFFPPGVSLTSVLLSVVTHRLQIHLHGHSLLLTADLKSIVAQYVNAFKKLLASVKKLQMHDKRKLLGGHQWSICQKRNLLVSWSAFKRLETFSESENCTGLGAMSERPRDTKRKKTGKANVSFLTAPLTDLGARCTMTSG